MTNQQGHTLVTREAWNDLRRVVARVREGGHGSTAYRILRRALPGFGVEHWRHLGGGDGTLVAALDGCNCDECERRRADAYDPPVLPGMPARPVIVVLDDDAPVDTIHSPCACSQCSLTECDGDCELCDDYGCTQCHPDGCPGDSVRTCCGYCRDCDSHHDDYNDSVCDMGHCHDCNHHCEGN